MNDYGWGLFKKGLKRRRKEVGRMRVMTCLAVFFLVFILLLQDNLNAYRMQANYRTFGSWAVRCEDDSFEGEPSLEPCGSILRGSMLYRLRPGALETDPATGEPYGDTAYDFDPPDTLEIGFSNHYRNTYLTLGAFSEQFAEEQNIGLYNGRWPETDGEIVMELYALEALGYSYDLGQEISFYLAERDDPVLLNAECERVYREDCEKWLAEHPGQEPPKDDLGFGDDLGDGEDGEAGEAPNPDAYPQRERYTIPYVFGQKKLYKVSFTLVGTVERYSMSWDLIEHGEAEGMNERGAFLPSAIVTAARFDSLPMDTILNRFYDFIPELRKGSVWDTAEQLFGLYENAPRDPASFYTLNRSAYTNPLWGGAGMYRGMTALLTVLSACILAYLMASYLGRRRPYFMRMREIGASTGEVFRMAAYECVLSVLPYALAALALSFAAAFLAAFVIGRATGVHFRFALPVKTVLSILACIAVTIALALAAALLIFAGRGISEKKRTLSSSAARSIKRRGARKSASKRPYLSCRETLVRDRKAHRVKTFMLRLMCILVVGVILFCAFEVAAAAKRYHLRRIGYSDVDASVKGLFNIPNYTIPYKPNKYGRVNEELRSESGECPTMLQVFSREFMDELGMLPGIANLRWYGRDTLNFTVDWDGKAEDPFFQSVYYSYLHSMNLSQRTMGDYDLESGASTRFKKYYERKVFWLYGDTDSERLWTLLRRWADPKVADKEKFLSGEQVFITVDDTASILPDDLGENWKNSTVVLPEIPENAWDGLGHSFEPGESITCSFVGRELDAQICGIVPLSKAEEAAAYISAGSPRFENYIMQVVGSQGFLERAVELIRQDPDEPFDVKSRYTCVNNARIDLGELSVNESTLKAVAATCAKHHVEYSNNVEMKLSAREELIRSITTYGLFGAILTVLFFFVISSIQTDEDAALAEKVGILRRAGLERSAAVRQRVLDAALQTLPLLLGFVAFTAIYGIQSRLFRLLYETLFNEDAMTRLADTSFPAIARMFMPQVTLPCLALLMLIYFLITSGVLRRGEKTE